MQRPKISDEAIQAVNRECEEIMAVEPEEVRIERRIEMLAESHKELRKAAKAREMSGDGISMDL